MHAILVNYNYVPEWLLSSSLDYHIFDRSDNREYLKNFPQDRITYTENIGQVDYDKLLYLVDNYDTLPTVFLWGKTNLFKYISEKEYAKLKDNQTFTPLLSQTHKTYSDDNGPICYYRDGAYYERNNSWYVNQFDWKYCKYYSEFAYMFGLPNPLYLPFAPGGNYILTKEVVHKYPRDFYESLANVLNYCSEPAEAQMCERSYYTMWK